MENATFDTRSSGLPRPAVASAKATAAESNIFDDLREALRERIAIIRDDQSRRDEANHIARLRAVSEKIDRLHAALPQPIDPQLAHYLQRRSYDKALEFLEGRND
jgi:hypothetical protein